MSENRARYSSAPLRDMNRRPPKPHPNAYRPPAQPVSQTGTAPRSFPLLQVMLILVLPVMFIVSLLLKDVRLYWAFVGLSLLCLLAMALLHAFVPNARKVLGVVHTAMIAVVLFALLVSSPPAPADTVQPTQSLQSIFSDNSSASMVDMAQKQTSQSQPEATENPGSASLAQQKLEQFMSSWMNSDYTGMVALSTPNWVNSHMDQQDAEKSMFHLRANRSVIDYQVLDVSGNDGDQTRTITMQATISKNNGGEPLLYNFQILMVRVNVWYVDPNSISSSPVVNSSAQQSQAQMGAQAQAEEQQQPVQAQAPQVQTVSPDTVLYYNADGGKYYHINPDCSSIAAKYRPLTATFYYRDVSSTKFKNLIPCSECQAPAR